MTQFRAQKIERGTWGVINRYPDVNITQKAIAWASEYSPEYDIGLYPCGESPE